MPQALAHDRQRYAAREKLAAVRVAEGVQTGTVESHPTLRLRTSVGQVTAGDFTAYLWYGARKGVSYVELAASPVAQTWRVDGTTPRVIGAFPLGFATVSTFKSSRPSSLGTFLATMALRSFEPRVTARRSGFLRRSENCCSNELAGFPRRSSRMDVVLFRAFRLTAWKLHQSHPVWVK